MLLAENRKLVSRLRKILTGKGFQIKFKDRVTAANTLTTMLKRSFKNITNSKNVIVIGIPRGGIVVADTIANNLSSDFEVVISRKLRDVDNEEVAIGAITEDGTTYLNEYYIELLNIPAEHIQQETIEQLKEIERRKHLFNANSSNYGIADKTVILVDDGAATGSTIIAAARLIKKYNPKKIIIAIPIAQPEVVRLLEKEVDDVIVLTIPSNFVTVGQFYQNFEPISDERVVEILKNRKFI